MERTLWRMWCVVLCLVLLTACQKKTVVKSGKDYRHLYQYGQSEEQVSPEWSPRGAVALSEIEEQVRRFKQEFGIEIDYQDNGYWGMGATTKTKGLDYGRLSLDDYAGLARMIRSISEAFRSLPEPALKAAEIGTIGIFKHLTYNRGPQAGLAFPRLDIIFVDIYSSRSLRKGQKLVIHHEFLHRLEHHHPSLFTKSTWEKKFGKHRYSGLVRYTSHTSALVNFPGDGFVSEYAKTNPMEDRAELFKALMDPDYREQIKTWVERDPILKKKVREMVTALRKYGFDQSWPDFKHWKEITIH